MSQVKVQGDPSGTGIFTIASPNSNSNATFTLPTTTGTVQVSGNPISGTTGTFTGLVDISAAGAGQIQFPATQNASSNANTLDDYEEGTWTPIYVRSVTNPTATYASTFGVYRKIGSLVYVAGRIFTSAVSSAGSGDVYIGGLPFAVASQTNDYGHVGIGVSFGPWPTNMFPASGFPMINTTQLLLSTYNSDDPRNGLDTRVNNLTVGSGNGLVFSSVYISS